MNWIKRGKESTPEEVFFRNIGVSSFEEINEWHRKSFAGKYRIDGIKDAVELALRFKEAPVTIVGDYDADGVTSTSILYLALEWAGFKNVSFRIPRRFTEGFGINPAIIDEIRSGLVITCDNGVAQLEAIQKAKDKGLTVIILDHHLPATSPTGDPVMPPADIIIDPNAIPGSADFAGYCGAGLCYRFAMQMLADKPSLSRRLLALAAIGTVADVMDLRQENYILVRSGLKLLEDPRTCPSGLFALASALNLRHVSAKDVGFKIGPCINASSRMKDDGAADVVKLLVSEDSYVTLLPAAERLVEINEKRKTAKKEGLAKAKDVIAKNVLYGETPLMLVVPDVQEGIIGIIAGQLAEEYKVPSIVLTDLGDGVLRGSARSVEGFDIKAALDECADLLVKYGGHTGAAGLSLRPDDFPAFKERMLSLAEGFVPVSCDDIFYDLEIDSKEIPSMIERIEKFGPYGQGNPDIVFKIRDFAAIPKAGSYKKAVGDDGVKLFSTSVTAIGFGMAERMGKIAEPKRLDMVGVLSTNWFGGKGEAQLEFEDFELKQIEKVETPLAAKLKAMAVANS